MDEESREQEKGGDHKRSGLYVRKRDASSRSSRLPASAETQMTGVTRSSGRSGSRQTCYSAQRGPGPGLILATCEPALPGAVNLSLFWVSSPKMSLRLNTQNTRSSSSSSSSSRPAADSLCSVKSSKIP
ncbi:hypothetical protein EYF80_017714 [Liparis tanakae]|uniref:Uncharacterized protein n=1 Tax=Liparis tanakae TaxID=230148 RepID=A0A4Z2I1I7_9TELE|nr:hypothetical protein EYF80_017714 [Liparis tanakae]